MLMRSIAATDDRTRPRENLATNPKFKRAVAGTSFTRRNRVLNPRFHRALAEAGVPVRRNLCGDPRAAGGAVWNLTRITKGVLPNGKTGLILARDAALGTPSATWFSASRPTCTPGEVIAYSVEGILAPGTRLMVDLSFFRADGTTISNPGRRILLTPGDNAGGGTLAYANPGVPTRFGGTYAAPAEAVRFQMRIFSDSGADGTMYASDVLVERRPDWTLPYFDGSTIDGSGIVYEWEGEANASPSIAKASVAEVARNIIPVPVLSKSREGWTTPGAVTAGHVPDGLRIDATGTVAAGGSALHRSSASEIPLVVGETWTILFRVRNVGTVNVSLRASLGANGQTSSADPTTIPPGVTATLTHTVTITEVDGTAGRPVLRVGLTIPAGAAFVVLDNPVAMKSPRVPGPFSGAATPDADLTPAWVGAENNSESVLYGVRSTHPAGGAGRVAYRSWRGGLTIADMANLGAAGANLVTSTSSLGVGRQVTVLAEVDIPADYVPAVDEPPYSRAIHVWSSSITAQAPAAPGRHLVRLKMTVPNTTQALRLTGVNGGQKVTWIRALIVDGDYDGPFFDGDTDPDDSNIAYSWDGTPHASTSKMQATAVEVRRNIAPDPRATTQLAAYGFGASREAVTGITDHPENISTANRIAVAPDTTIGSSGGGARLLPLDAIESSGTYTVSLWAKLEAPIMAGESGGVVALAVASSSSQVSPVQPVADEWRRISWTRSLSPGADLGFRFANGTTAGSVLISGILVEPASGLLPYFDGSSGSPDGDLVARWTGAQDGSVSMLEGIRVDPIVYTAPARTVMSPSHPRTPLRVTRRSDGDGLAQYIRALPGGRTYTILLTSYRPTPLALEGSVALQEASGAYRGHAIIPGGTTIDGVQTWRRVVHLADDWAGNSRINLRTGSGVGDTTWYGELAIIEGAYDGPFFDGDMPGVIWRGVPHASASVGFPSLA